MSFSLTCPKGHRYWGQDRYSICVVCDENRANDELNKVIEKLGDLTKELSELDKLRLEVRVLRKMVVTPRMTHPPSANIRKLRDYYQEIIDELGTATQPPSEPWRAQTAKPRNRGKKR